MKKHFLFAASAASLGFALPAAAQSIDYGSLQELFNEPVTTSATGSPQRSTEAPADMQIISQDDIRRSGETTIPGILTHVAGMDILNFSAGHADVSVRGYDQTSSPRLLVLVNGRQVYLDHYGTTIWQTIPVQLDEIRQIEVVKGPNSALFGFNAVSGVVNIITFNPKFDDTDVATVRIGDHGQKMASLVSTFKLGSAISARVSAGGEASDEWARPSKLSTALPLASTLHDPRRASAALDVVAQLAPKTELRVEGSWANSQETLAAGTGLAYVKAITTSEKATLTSDTRYGQLQAQVYQNQLQSKYRISGSPYNWDNTITVASVQDLFKIGAAHTIRIGGEYRHNTLNVQPIAGGDVSYNVISASAMWNWAINDKLTSTLALREDSLKLHRSGPFPARIPLGDNRFWDRTVNEPSVNATLSWKPTATDTVRISYGRGVKAPSLIEMGGLVLTSGPVYLLGNPGLEPTIVNNYEAAYDHEFKAAKFGVRLFMQDWTAITGSFDTTSLDYLPNATTAPGFSYKNVLDSKMKGVELTASGKLAASFGWHADYTYTDLKDSPYVGANLVNRTAAFAQTTPESRGNVGGSWTQGPWEADANVHYVGKFLLYDPNLGGALTPVKAYATLSSRLGYRMENGLTLAVSGQGLLNKQQTQTHSLPVERRVQGTISKSW